MFEDFNIKENEESITHILTHEPDEIASLLSSDPLSLEDDPLIANLIPIHQVLRVSIMIAFISIY